MRLLALAACAAPRPQPSLAQSPAVQPGAARTPRRENRPRITSIPGGQIQDALEAAARDPVNKTVYVHAGTYRPAARGQALIWFNARHDGITLEAVGDVILTAANPDDCRRRAPSYPAVVNHVVYFGDGVSRKTVFRGFKITGANNFTTGSGEKSPIESDDIRKTPFFYTDGGGIKIYARSYPDDRARRGLRQLHEPLRRRRVGRAPRADRRSRCCSATASSATTARRPPDRPSTCCTAAARRLKTASSSATSPTWAWTSSACSTGGEYHPEHGSGAMTVFDGSQRDGQPQHVHRQLERRGRRRDRQHLRRFDLLEEQRSPAASRRARATSSTSPTAAGVRGTFIHGDVNDLAGRSTQRREHARSA